MDENKDVITAETNPENSNAVESAPPAKPNAEAETTVTETAQPEATQQSHAKAEENHADNPADERDIKIAELEKQLAEERVNSAVAELLLKERFTSERVKNSVAAEIKAQNFKLIGGILEGAEALLKSIKEAEPNIFAPKQAPQGVFLARTGNADVNDVSLKDAVFGAFGLKA